MSIEDLAPTKTFDVINMSVNATSNFTSFYEMHLNL